MNILFLCAGFGTRLQRDVQADPQYAHLAQLPKPLFPLNGVPLLSHWTRILPSSNIFLVCNSKYAAQFEQWAATNNFPQSNILSNNIDSNDKRNGAVADLNLAINHFNLRNSPLLVVAGDTLLLHDFDLKAFIQSYESIQSSIITYYKVSSDDELSKSGIIELHQSTHSLLKVTNFLEKPSPAQTTSRFASPCFYLFHPSALPLVQKFIDEKTAAGTPRDDMDATGTFIAYLIHQHPTYAYPISGRLDIGNLPSYIHANNYIINQQNNAPKQL